MELEYPSVLNKPYVSGVTTGPPVEPTIAEAVTRWNRQRGGKLVLILDQVEAALGDEQFVRDVLGFTGWPADADVAVVLSVREDHLARLLARAQIVEPGIPLVRLPPLDLDGARAAIIGPLTEARLAIEPELLDALLADLQRAASAAVESARHRRYTARTPSASSRGTSPARRSDVLPVPDGAV